jgi:hypothetical protein
VSVYTTFFVCSADELPTGFPEWRSPLPEPVRREFRNPFTGTIRSIETREPEWPDDVGADDLSEYQATAIVGSYDDYLETRLLPFVRSKDHWASKGITEDELDSLSQALDIDSGFEPALYAPPSRSSTLLIMPPEWIQRLVDLDVKRLSSIAESFGSEITNKILIPLVELARKAKAGQSMYLLTEAGSPRFPTPAGSTP